MITLLRIAGLCVLLAALPAASADALSEARELHAKGDYAGAADKFASALATESPRAAIYFEIGQNLTKSGYAAAASLAYRRALFLDPTLLPARAALRDSELALGIQPSVPSWRDSVAAILPMDISAVIGAGLFWVGILAVLLAFLAAKPLPSRLIIAVCLAFLGLLLVAVVWTTDPRVVGRRDAVLLKNGGASLLREPADSSEKLTSLSQGALLRILSQRGRWVFAETGTGTKGWLLAEGVESIIPK